MRFELTILGSGAALPTLKRNATAQYLTIQNRHILIDCGEGTQLQMRKFGVKIQRITIILISHLHGDHFFGLAGLVSTMRLLGRDKNLTIICPAGLREILMQQLEIGHIQLDFEINFIELTGKESKIVFEDNAIEIKTFPLKHRVPTNGFRIGEKPKERELRKSALEHPEMKVEFIHRLKKGEDVQTENGNWLKAEEFTKPSKPPKSYAYCSDTAYSEKTIAEIEGATVLYHEATFTENHASNAKKTMHATAKQAAKIAKAAKVGSLYMGHLSARYADSSVHEEEAREVFEASHYVLDGQVITIK